jgi:hypothetical protein
LLLLIKYISKYSFLINIRRLTIILSLFKSLKVYKLIRASKMSIIITYRYIYLLI